MFAATVLLKLRLWALGFFGSIFMNSPVQEQVCGTITGKPNLAQVPAQRVTCNLT